LFEGSGEPHVIAFDGIGALSKGFDGLTENVSDLKKELGELKTYLREFCDSKMNDVLPMQKGFKELLDSVSASGEDVQEMIGSVRAWEAKYSKLWDDIANHPVMKGFAERLARVEGAIDQLSKKEKNIHIENKNDIHNSVNAASDGGLLSKIAGLGVSGRGFLGMGILGKVVCGVAGVYLLVKTAGFVKNVAAVGISEAVRGTTAGLVGAGSLVVEKIREVGGDMAKGFRSFNITPGEDFSNGDNITIAGDSGSFSGTAGGSASFFSRVGYTFGWLKSSCSRYLSAIPAMFYTSILYSFRGSDPSDSEIL
jgi:hypothetical protein